MNTTTVATDGHAAITVTHVRIHVESQYYTVAYGMLFALSRRFAREAAQLRPAPNTTYVTWRLPNYYCNLDAVEHIMTWAAGLNLPLPKTYKGTKSLPLKNEWFDDKYLGSLQPTYRLCRYLELGDKLSDHLLYNELRDLVFATGVVDPEIMGMLWMGLDGHDGLRRHIIHKSVHHAYENYAYDEFADNFAEWADPALATAFHNVWGEKMERINKREAKNRKETQDRELVAQQAAWVNADQKGNGVRVVDAEVGRAMKGGS